MVVDAVKMARHGTRWLSRLLQAEDPWKGQMGCRKDCEGSERRLSSVRVWGESITRAKGGIKEWEEG